MILVPVEVRPSKIHGLGVFARARVHPGTEVARWTYGVDYVLWPETYERLPRELRFFLEPFVWVGENGCFYGTVGESHFINHDRPANLTWYEESKTSVANRLILIGEEITEDYEQFDKSFDTYCQLLHFNTTQGGTP